MERAMFLYKEKGLDSRKDIIYIEKACFECGHYFSEGDLVGAGWSGRELKVSKEWYDNIETILKKFLTHLKKILDICTHIKTGKLLARYMKIKRK